MSELSVLHFVVGLVFATVPLGIVAGMVWMARRRAKRLEASRSNWQCRMREAKPRVGRGNL